MFALMARLAVSLAIVIGLMVLIAGFMRKRGLVVGAGGSAGRRSSTPVAIDLVNRRHLGRQAQVAVVRTAGRLLVLGVTDHQVTLLAERAADEIDATPTSDIEVLDVGADGSGTMGPQRTGSPTVAASHPGPAWKTMLDTMRDRTVRR